MKYLKLYENFEFNEDDFDEEEESPYGYHFYTHNIEKENYLRTWYYGKVVEGNNMILFNNHKFDNWSYYYDKKILRPITNEEHDFLEENFHEEKIVTFDSNDTTLPYDVFLKYIENNHWKQQPGTN